MKINRTIVFVLVILVAAFITACVVNYKRIASEASNNTVEITIDQSDVDRLSVFSHVPVVSILSKLRSAGAVSVALTEDLPSSVDINFLSGTDPKKMDIYLSSRGLSKKKIELIKKAGLNVIPRIRNSFNQSRSSIHNKIKSIAGFRTVIFAEEEVLGYPNYLKEAANAIRSNGLRYGFVEFGKQLGDTSLAYYMGGNMVKVHSIPVDEMEDLSKYEMIKRFSRAAKERDIRIMYVHLLQYPDNGKDLVDTNIGFIKNIKADLEMNGFRIGQASMPSKVTVSRYESLMMSAGVACGAILLLSCFMGTGPVLSLIIILICMLLPVKLVTLLSAIVFPSYGVISQFPVKKEEFGLGIISRSISITMNVAGITAVGALMIAALLADKITMLGVDAFTGVKIAFVLPIAIVACYFFLRDESSGKIDLKGVSYKIMKVLNINITFLYALIALIVAGAAALLILRSGNFGLPVSGGEKFTRGLLENILSVRPRTKEFLIGYPALILASIYFIRGYKTWLWAILSVGILAPISLVNSFCHIHSPVMISISRSCVGLILGVAVGLMVYFVLGTAIWLYNRKVIR